MPLILAIEPDKRQAAHITSMARHRLHAELVLADSAERAFAALGDRIPDLILTPALLAPQDEAAVADRLRQLDERAAHVQTLTVPLLAAPRRSSPARGMLAALRRERPGASADGCDPEVFAEQITAYLERAAIERKTHDVADEDEMPVTEASRSHAEPSRSHSIPEPFVPDAMAAFPEPPNAAEPPRVEEVPIQAEHSAPPPEETFAAFAAFEKPRPVLDETAPALDVVAAVEAAPEDPQFELVDIVEDDANSEEVEGEEEADEEIDLAPLLSERTSLGSDPASAAAAIMAAVAAAEHLTESAPAPGAPDVDLWMPRRFAAQPPWPALEGVQAETIGTAPAAAAVAEPDSRKSSKKSPLQDEWGIFDPAQCGFAALLAKLEEITEKEDVRST